MQIRRMLAIGSAVVVLGAGLVAHPATAVDSDYIACEGTANSINRTSTVDLTGTGTATCVWTIGGGVPGSGTVNVSFDVSEPTCMTYGADMTVVLGPSTYTFAYFGAGASGSGVAVETGASKDDMSRVAVGGALVWVDAQRITAQVCAGLAPMAGVNEWPRFVISGYYPPVSA